MTGHITDETRREIALAVGPDWQAGRHQPRHPEAEITTPSLDEMAVAPGATQTKYRVTYDRVGRHGGRNGSPAPAPLTVWAVTADGLAEHIAKDVRPYLASGGAEVTIDLEAMNGQIFAGFRTAGSFTLEAVQVAEGGDEQ
ncbi:hypothetical protein [Streptomyces sp. SID161]|uniref:hypothetical protein n=1 Tax=Streptomyces sp. SID161 TaxID=2690251 RepID=UPI00136B91A3|nr:hypothetical protein [Streptomyces sp. SID161]MYW48839.1 hypothetical protein [Streptomyces sp. SID161]MYW49876.1 hypothetical protein [Streptomyces sp. SID161]